MSHSKQYPRIRVSRIRVEIRSYESGLTAPGFLKLFEDLRQDPKLSTLEATYEAAEAAHVTEFGHRRYSSYESFKQIRKIHIRARR